MNRILPLVILAAACGKTDRHAPSAAPAAPAASAGLSSSGSPSPAQAPALEHATQSDLASEIAEADRLGTWRDIQHRWQGQRLRWTVTRQRLLCSSAEDCNVAAFPIQRPAKQGWMPLLSFAPGQYDELIKVCGSQEQCEVTIEGTLSELDISPELPTKVTLSNVRVVPAPAGRVQTAHR
jgi:hypothetical protein